jgi:hypothetical protein
MAVCIQSWSNELYGALAGRKYVIYIAATRVHAVHPILPGPEKDFWMAGSVKNLKFQNL